MKNANGVIKKLTSAERSYYTAAEVREILYCFPGIRKTSIWHKECS